MNHPFFADLDWNALVELKLTAPYIPEIRTDEIDPNSQSEDNNVLSEIKQQDDYDSITEKQ